MIDWLTAAIPLHHKPIPTGRRLHIDANGELISDFVLSGCVENEEGSYSSKLLVSSSSDFYSHYFKHEEGYCSSFVISGNPAKFLQGHNCFGIECIRSLLIRTIERIAPQLPFNHFQIQQLIRAVKCWAFRVTRIDITRSFDLGSNEAVNKYLRMLQFVADTRGNRCEFTKNTFYVGKNSGLWSVKFYNKFVEITSRSKAHRLPVELTQSGITEFIHGKLRIELVLRKQQIDRLGLLSVSDLQDKLDSIYNDFLGRIVMKNQQNEFDYKKLKEHYQRTYLLWKNGEDVSSFMERATFYRHAKFFREYGINLKKPPIPDTHREALIRPLPLLIPKAVSVPENLSKYQVKLAV